MRRRSPLLILVLFLVSWIAFTYHFLQRAPQDTVLPLASSYQKAGVQTKLEGLETELRKQKLDNAMLLRGLHAIRARRNGNNSSMVLPLPQSGLTGSNAVIPVLLFACNRVTVKRPLDQLIKYRPSKEQFPIIVSADCNHKLTLNTIRTYGDEVQLIQQPDQSDYKLPPKQKKFKGYYKIARHYGWALNKTFIDFNYNSVIIVEDDLEVSPDFFEYFHALQPILDADQTLYCVSAWNDNGKQGLTSANSTLLYRSDFFPGLGWMMTKDLWMELMVKWPKAFWDDWIREPEQRRNRACIRPEISRTKTFGKIGVSNGLFFEKHLKFIKLNENPVTFTKKDLSYLMKDNYDVEFVKDVYGSPAVPLNQLIAGDTEHPITEAVRVTYDSKTSFKKIAKALSIMDDFKSGVPRTGYRGVVSCMHKGRRVYVAPPAAWSGYDTTWT